MKEGTDSGIRETFADIASTTADILDLGEILTGRSFKDEIIKTLKL